MDDDLRHIDQKKFSNDFRREFKVQLTSRVKQQPSKRTRPATETVLKAMTVATSVAANNQWWPSNSPVEVTVYADKENEFIREILAGSSELKNISVSSCVGSNLDFQARIGSQILVNGECELHGAKRRTEDMRKLVEHEENAAISVMVARGKSKGQTDRILRNISSEMNKISGHSSCVILDWKNNKPLDTANIIIKDNTLTEDEK